MPDRIIIPFAGEGSGSGELSWGQKTVWRGVLARGAPMWLVGSERLPAGTTVDDVAGDLAFLMGRHQALRTHLLIGDDEESDVQQVVSSSGETTLEIVDAQDDADPGEVARALEASYEEADRDYAKDWPIKVAVVRHRGVLAYQVTAMCHTSVDGFSLLAIKADLDGRDPVTGSPRGPVTAMPPLEQARLQTSPTGQRRSAAVERHWERVLRVIPPRRFPESTDHREPRHWQATFSSRAVYLATQAIAARAQVDTSPVLLAAFAVGLTRTSGINPAAPRMMVNNRFRPRLGNSVSPLSQTCPCVIDVAGITFDEAVARAYRASIAAFKNAYFEPVRIREILAAVTEERGEEIDVQLLYNDRRSVGAEGEVGVSAGMGRGVTGALPTPQELRAALPSTTLSLTQTDGPVDTCHIHVVPSQDTVDVLVFFDTYYVSPGDTESFLRQMEAVTVEAAFDPDALTGIAAPA